ncbi:hypothetical protein WJX84_004546 [Apatococcus fuscideae]|uniref:F-box domain-containing protein n=1 Tax=Apatococcus fuscideae TaxID=2026836 RepID=A0AAW1T6Y8_9CHLO
MAIRDQLPDFTPDLVDPLRHYCLPQLPARSLAALRLVSRAYLDIVDQASGLAWTQAACGLGIHPLQLPQNQIDGFLLQDKLREEAVLLAKMRAGKSAAACDIHLDLDECIKSMQPSPPIAQGCLLAILIRDAQEAVEHLSVVETTNGKWSTILTTLSLDTSSDSPLDPLTRRMRREAQNLNISVDDHLDMFDAQKHTGRIGPLHELLEFRWLPSGQAFWLLGRYKGRDCSMQVIAADDGHSLASREILEEEETLIAVPAHACPEIGVTIDKSSQSTLKVYNLATLQIRDRVELGHGRAGRASMYAKALKISSDGADQSS